MERHFTATVYIFHQNRVLLHFHKKLGKWLPPGGHVEPNETPPAAAKREAKEECDLEIAFIEQENLKIEGPNAVSFERPFMCVLENVPPQGDQAAHQHMDFIYLAKPLECSEAKNGFRWVNWEELQEFDIFPDTRETLRLILTSDGVVSHFG
jgi:8-oxo-dGTP pyrophosphatase MutT (NUDIX family)